MSVFKRWWFNAFTVLLQTEIDLKEPSLWLRMRLIVLLKYLQKGTIAILIPNFIPRVLLFRDNPTSCCDNSLTLV